MQFATPLLPLCEMLASTWDENNYMCFFSTTFNSFCRLFNIVLTKNGIHTLANIVITNPTWMDLLSQSCATLRFAIFYVVQTKEFFYHNQHPINQFLPLTIEIFGCLHKHVNMFLHNCTNAIWSLKGLKGFHFSTLVTFFHQKFLITFQRMQTSSILSQAIDVGLATFRFPPLKDTPPITRPISC